MDETPNLLSNIRFKETKKGYDPEQVDNFMLKLGEQVGELREMLRQAAQRAEVAEAQVNDATKAKAAAEAAVEQAKAEVAKAREEAAAQPASAGNEIEAASGVLAMAQKTADAAIEEAEAKAKDIVAEGRSRAAVMVIEAEQEIDRIKSRASQQIDKLAAERTSEVDAEVARLKGERDQLKIDVDMLRSYVEEHRAKLRLGVEALERIINEEGALDLGEAPDVSATDGVGASSTSGAARGASGDAPGVGAPADAASGDSPAREADAAAEPDTASSPDSNAEATASVAPAAAPQAPAADDAASATSATPSSIPILTPEPDGTVIAAPVVIPASPDREASPGSPAVPQTAGAPAPGRADEPTRTLDTEVAPAPVAEPAPAEPASEPSEGDGEPRVPLVTLEDVQRGTTAPAATSPSDAPRSRAEDPAAAVHVSSLLEGPAASATAPSGPTTVVIGTDAPAPVTARTEPDTGETVNGQASGSSVTASMPAAGTSTGATPTVDLTSAAAADSSPAAPAGSLFGDAGEPTQLFDVLADDTPSPRVVLTRDDTPGAAPSVGRATTPLVNRELPLPAPGKQQVDSSLGSPDAEADEAMRAFFEQDPETGKEQKTGRFLRRK